MSDRADRFTVVLDANVLAGALTRNVLLSLAEAGLYRPRWSAPILDEVERYVAERIGDASKAKLRRSAIEQAFEEANVSGFEPLIQGLELPDPKDVHVLACAIQTRAAIIVSDNLKDFPQSTLSEYDLECVGLDDFIADLLDLADVEAVAALRRMRLRFDRPEIDATRLLSEFERLGLLQTANILIDYQELL